ncbi:hypothetical protein EXIGLDRAFT_448172 [Exidia glandulosa HHB12029]|uniref:Secreted protein n=1 Tax=Exidia glandulosa HHB12029 TaxID=1314781 RepID=A0A165B528_EXIGL|nr:hypothetical protein EXIGLDRAFT_448172 [Exidia glandulosa HHB12029]
MRLALTHTLTVAMGTVSAAQTGPCFEDSKTRLAFQGRTSVQVATRQEPIQMCTGRNEGRTTHLYHPYNCACSLVSLRSYRYRLALAHTLRSSATLQHDNCSPVTRSTAGILRRAFYGGHQH